MAWQRKNKVAVARDSIVCVHDEKSEGNNIPFAQREKLGDGKNNEFWLVR